MSLEADQVLYNTKVHSNTAAIPKTESSTRKQDINLEFKKR